MPRGRVLAAIAAAALVVAAAVVLLLVREDGDSTAAGGDETTTASPSASSTAHEDDHVDTVDPDVDPDDYVQFCDAFFVFANAYSNAVADGDPGDSVVLASAADSFRAVADGTDLTDEVRAGLAWFVDDAQRIPDDATEEERNAFSTFLNSACPA